MTIRAGGSPWPFVADEREKSEIEISVIAVKSFIVLVNYRRIFFEWKIYQTEVWLLKMLFFTHAEVVSPRRSILETAYPKENNFFRCSAFWESQCWHSIVA